MANFGDVLCPIDCAPTHRWLLLHSYMQTEGEPLRASIVCRLTYQDGEVLRFEIHPARCLNAYALSLHSCHSKSRKIIVVRPYYGICSCFTILLGCIPMICIATCSSIDFYELLPNGDLKYYKASMFIELILWLS